MALSLFSARRRPALLCEAEWPRRPRIAPLTPRIGTVECLTPRKSVECVVEVRVVSGALEVTLDLRSPPSAVCSVLAM